MEATCEQCKEELGYEYFTTECCGEVCYSCFEGITGEHAHHVCDDCHTGFEYYGSCPNDCEYDGVQ